MGDVIAFPEKDFKNCTYTVPLEDVGMFGVAMRDGSLEIRPITKDSIMVIADGVSISYSREELAEFIGVVSVLIDADCKFLDVTELVSLNY